VLSLNSRIAYFTLSILEIVVKCGLFRTIFKSLAARL
jgi:hypothetical protein